MLTVIQRRAFYDAALTNLLKLGRSQLLCIHLMQLVEAATETNLLAKKLTAVDLFPELMAQKPTRGTGILSWWSLSSDAGYIARLTALENCIISCDKQINNGAQKHD